MPTVGKCMRAQRARVGAEEVEPGPSVLIEAESRDEAVLPQSQLPGSTGQRWKTGQIRWDEATIKKHNEERTQAMRMLQSAIADTCAVHAIRKTGRNEEAGVTIGRSKHNDIVLGDETVSATHARIVAGDGALLLADDGSANGTFVNRRRLESGERTRLTSGDCLRFGSVVLYFLTGERFQRFLSAR